jgi:hypothetical protein
LLASEVAKQPPFSISTSLWTSSSTMPSSLFLLHQHFIIKQTVNRQRLLPTTQNSTPLHSTPWLLVRFCCSWVVCVCVCVCFCGVLFPWTLQHTQCEAAPIACLCVELSLLSNFLYYLYVSILPISVFTSIYAANMIKSRWFTLGNFYWYLIVL